MKNRIYRTLALSLGLTAIFATSNLNATIFYSERVDIPFEFKVGKHVYSSGTYRVEQSFGSDIATLVNLKTGQRVQMLVPVTNRSTDKNLLKFENKNGVRTLKALS
ncbi:MAG: hypothetical protein JWP63_23 [Candidatus Solibacter sp.]|jgi:hypothetical protein|nr:hypothetical protein [Candidatus Solibacter sp.]